MRSSYRVAGQRRRRVAQASPLFADIDCCRRGADSSLLVRLPAGVTRSNAHLLLDELERRAPDAPYIEVQRSNVCGVDLVAEAARARGYITRYKRGAHIDYDAWILTPVESPAPRTGPLPPVPSRRGDPHRPVE